MNYQSDRSLSNQEECLISESNIKKNYHLREFFLLVLAFSAISMIASNKNAFISSDLSLNTELKSKMSQVKTGSKGSSEVSEESSTDIDFNFNADSSQVEKVYSSDELYFTTKNEYGYYEGPYPWLSLGDGAQLVEPYRDTTVKLAGTLYDDENDYTFKWSVKGSNEKLETEEEEFYGSKIYITYLKTGIFGVTVRVYNETGVYLGRYSSTLIVKYVKRELRSLTLADREAFLSAAVQLWTYTTDDGREIYGEDFVSI